jgi:hypothetical protein
VGPRTRLSAGGRIRPFSSVGPARRNEASRPPASRPTGTRANLLASVTKASRLGRTAPTVSCFAGGVNALALRRVRRPVIPSTVGAGKLARCLPAAALSWLPPFSPVGVVRPSSTFTLPRGRENGRRFRAIEPRRAGSRASAPSAAQLAPSREKADSVVQSQSAPRRDRRSRRRRSSSAGGGRDTDVPRESRRVRRREHTEGELRCGESAATRRAAASTRLHSISRR